MNQRCLEEFKVKYTKKKNMGGQLLISIFAVRSGSEALAVSSEESYWSQFFRQEQLGELLYLKYLQQSVRSQM